MSPPYEAEGAEERTYHLPLAYDSLRAEAEPELRSLGFRPMRAGKDFVEWRRNDLTVALCEAPRKHGGSGTTDHRSEVLCGNPLRDGLLTKLRLNLISNEPP